jgi:deoxyribose-phosphate aldolase
LNFSKEIEFMSFTAQDIAKMIDHSLLRPELTEAEVRSGCQLAAEFDVATVCVKPCDVHVANEELKGTDVLVTTVIGFPHGSNLTEVKVFEAKLAIEQGCKELDMVLNIGRLKSRQFDYVQADIKAVCDVAHASNVIVKVILENAYLDDELKQIACRLCETAGADFVKTSTGFAPSGATVDDLKLMRAAVSAKVRVKAAGGVRTLGGAVAVREVGGVRFGATATKPILEEARQREKDGTLAEVKGVLGGSY